MAQEETAKTDILADFHIRQRALIEQLKQSPVREVLGVINAAGSGGGTSRGEDFWTLRFTFADWKFKNGELQKRPLTVQKQMSKDQLGAIMKTIKSYDIIEANIRVLEDASNKAQGLLLDIIGKNSSDADLNRVAQQLQEPVTLEDSQFGTFHLNRRINWYEVDTTWNSGDVRLNLALKDSEDPSGAISVARSLWQSQDSWNQRIYEYAVAKLLSPKNASWLQEDESEVTPEQFRNKMKQEAITVYSNGTFEFWFKDGDLFWGHSIMVKGNLTEGPTRADIPG
jgi:hypothetical protein